MIERLTSRFRDCATEKNYTLIRYDIIQGLRKLYDQLADETVRETALALIATEADSKYRKKYASLWRPGKSAGSSVAALNVPSIRPEDS